jgi:hypothetical protein
MLTLSTFIPDYYIKVDTYPYTESKELVKTLDHWWDHKARQHRYSESRSNYSVEGDEPHTLNYSFKEKLKDGNFSFLLKKTEVVGYQGLLLMDNGETGLCHRATADPENYRKDLGVWTSVFLPWQIKSAYELGCKQYKTAWNIHNYRQYRSLRDSEMTTRFKFAENKNIWQRFNFIGKQELFYTDQYVAVLDLTQDWIPDFIHSLNFQIVEV